MTAQDWTRWGVRSEAQRRYDSASLYFWLAAGLPVGTLEKRLFPEAADGPWPLS